jgi:hypothetical protein
LKDRYRILIHSAAFRSRLEKNLVREYGDEQSDGKFDMDIDGDG